MTTFHSFPAGVRAKFRSNRSFATVADPPVRRYGGLKDQDRIFTNIYCRHDHGIKGALVSLFITSTTQVSFIYFSLGAIGIAQKTFY